MLQNELLVAKAGVDTAENGAWKGLKRVPFQSPRWCLVITVWFECLVITVWFERSARAEQRVEFKTRRMHFVVLRSKAIKESRKKQTDLI